jgi:hypothetical protein
MVDTYYSAVWPLPSVVFRQLFEADPSVSSLTVGWDCAEPRRAVAVVMWRGHGRLRRGRNGDAARYVAPPR